MLLQHHGQGPLCVVVFLGFVLFPPSLCFLHRSYPFPRIQYLSFLLGPRRAGCTIAGHFSLLRFYSEGICGLFFFFFFLYSVQGAVAVHMGHRCCCPARGRGVRSRDQTVIISFVAVSALLSRLLIQNKKKSNSSGNKPAEYLLTVYSVFVKIN